MVLQFLLGKNNDEITPNVKCIDVESFLNFAKEQRNILN